MTFYHIKSSVNLAPGRRNANESSSNLLFLNHEKSTTTINRDSTNWTSNWRLSTGVLMKSAVQTLRRPINVQLVKWPVGLFIAVGSTASANCSLSLIVNTDRKLIKINNKSTKQCCTRCREPTVSDRLDRFMARIENSFR